MDPPPPPPPIQTLFIHKIEFEVVRNGSNLSLNRRKSTNREASSPKISRIICSAMKMVALLIEQKLSTSIIWAAKHLIWMSFQISFSMGSEGTSYIKSCSSVFPHHHQRVEMFAVERSDENELQGKFLPASFASRFSHRLHARPGKKRFQNNYQSGPVLL